MEASGEGTRPGWVVALAALIASVLLCFGATNASAGTTVISVPGEVRIVTNDNADHHLAIWTSEVELMQQTWPLESIIWTAAGGEAIRVAMEGWSSWQQAVLDSLNTHAGTPMPDLSGAPQAVRDLASRYDAARAEAVRLGNEVWTRMGPARQALASGSAADRLAQGIALRAAATAAQAALDAAETLSAQLWALVEASTTWGTRLATWLGVPLEQLRWGFHLLSRFTKIYLWASVGIAAVQMVSKHKLVIRDAPGISLNPIWPCKHKVRSTDGTEIPNVVSCPVADAVATWDPTNLFGIIDYTSMGIYTGAGKDDVRMHLTGDNPFDDISVEAGANNDTIIGSSIGDELIGGPGDDRILGRGGDDDIYGYNGTLVSSANNLDNDTLFGGAGRDFISGEWGADKIFGGVGDDSQLAGGSLLGGPGNDVITGGPGSDKIQGGDGRDTVLAKESDFPTAPGGSTPQTDTTDATIDCGSGSNEEQYVTFNTSEGGRVFNCIQPPSPLPTFTQLAGAPGVPELRPNALGNWPWFR